MDPERAKRNNVIKEKEAKPLGLTLFFETGQAGIEVAEAQGGVRTQEPEGTRHNIIEVASEEFALNGLSGARIDEIAESIYRISTYVPEADLMVALTNNDQVNILSSVMAKRLGCKATLVLINNPSFQDFTKTLGIDAATRSILFQPWR